MVVRAAAEAAKSRQNWIGPCHYLLAVLAQPCLATTALAELGITYQALSSQVSKLNVVNGKRRRYSRSRWTTSNPASHEVSGWAHGFAAAAGRANPTPDEWAVAVLYRNNDMIGSILSELGVSSEAAVAALRQRGVRVPDFEPPEHRPWRNAREIELDRAEWQRVVDVLSRDHPPGSEWRWGFNSRRDRPRKVQFVAEEGIDFDAILAEARVPRPSSS
ncbi:MAG TPA: Clp protease N-terminal domain-containing protein [Candidatus Dormibacteraeota bacterium]